MSVCIQNCTLYIVPPLIPHCMKAPCLSSSVYPVTLSSCFFFALFTFPIINHGLRNLQTFQPYVWPVWAHSTEPFQGCCFFVIFYTFSHLCLATPTLKIGISGSGPNIGTLNMSGGPPCEPVDCIVSAQCYFYFQITEL